MKIDVLYVEGCPNHLPAVRRIQQVLQDEDCQAVITEVLVPDAETDWMWNRMSRMLMHSDSCAAAMQMVRRPMTRSARPCELP
jgi:hypothetical protein